MLRTWPACLQPSATLKKTLYGWNPKHKIKRVACTQSRKTKRLLGLGEKAASSCLEQHLLSPAGEHSRVNSANSHGSAFSAYILRDPISQESNPMCTSLQTQNSKWKLGSGMELKRGRKKIKDSCLQDGLWHCGMLTARALKPEFLIWKMVV